MKKVVTTFLLSVLVATTMFLGGCSCCGDAPKCHTECGDK
jgi:hypothetical protein